MSGKKRIAVVGAGHNALVCACYLARDGHDVTVYEHRSRVGGAVNTEELWPGYHVDTCSVMHILIHKTPIVEELGLSRFGLEYMQMDPWGYAPFPDGSQITFYRDLDKTCQSIAELSESDAEAYRRFVTEWDLFNQGVFEAFSLPPTPGALVGGIARRTAMEQIRSRGKGNASMSGLPLLKKALGSYGKLLDETFTDTRLKAAIGWMAAQSGPPPSEIGAGALAGAHSLYHDVGATHPRGGSGMLALALQKCLESYGGEVRCNAAVEKIAVAGGKVRGLRLGNNEKVAADVVVSGAHVKTTLLSLLGDNVLPASLRAQVEALRVGNGIGMTVRCAVDRLPHYLAAGSWVEIGSLGHHDAESNREASKPRQQTEEYHSAMQLICPSIEYLQRAYDDAQRGYPAKRPALVAMTPSAVDPSIVPSGRHSLYIWAQYHPYRLAEGQEWDAIREREADRLLDTLAEYAPDIRGQVTDRYIQTPLDLERNIGLLHGNIMHLDMSLDQMFLFRPLPELSGYRTPIDGLFLTGASTHPGGGVSGASGRSAAGVIIESLRNSRGRRATLGVARFSAHLKAKVTATAQRSRDVKRS